LAEKICCVCGHKLDNHIDEGEVWRCHSLGQDAYQCECALRKGRTLEDEPDAIEQYDLQKRIDEKIQELKEGWE
jgi:hypothetical protein